MKNRLLPVVLTFFFFIFGLHQLSYNQERKKPDYKSKKPAPATFDQSKPEKLSICSHSITLNKKHLRYKSITGYMQMKNEADKVESRIFFVAYTLEGIKDKKNRPITFAFNGGPGSAALWLHMGALGPKRVLMSDEGFMVAQPFQYIDNKYSWLEFTDLVFIDPVSTGYSRPAQGVDKKKFHGLKEDISSVGDFIRLYITRNKRWLSPKYLCGESYGTTRAAGLSGYLQDTYGMYLKGIVLVSAVMHFQTTDFGPGNDLPYALFLPTYTASAWYHKKLPEKYQRNLIDTLKEVESWALSEYILALARGDKLEEGKKLVIIDRLANYTGLSKKFIDETNMRINIYDFACEIMREKKQTIGRLDSRFISGEIYAFYKEGFMADPSYSAIHGPYVAAVNDYIRNELKYENDLPYWAISRFVHPWNWGKKQGFVNVAETLRSAMIKNAFLKVMIANGYYDLATPYFATAYTVNHLNLPSDLAGNITMKYYKSGHMMYIRKASLKKLRDDAYLFYHKK